jgi:DNA (cytosine-5)-methyltransferase 1
VKKGTQSDQPSVPKIVAVDLFCGAGGLSYGLQQAGVCVAAGIDLDPTCSYPFQHNIDAAFIERDIRKITSGHLEPLWPEGSIRLLAGCAPCQPFSSHRRGVDTSDEDQWSLLSEFGRLVKSTKAELVTMENVPRLQRSTVFAEFVDVLRSYGYWVDWRICYGPNFGLAQQRRRLVLIASRMGPVEVPSENRARNETVRTRIGKLPRIAAGEADAKDPMHTSQALSELNLKRIRASSPGGTWKQWPANLRAPCHRKESGASFQSVYARMKWDEPSPTITTMSFNFGTGRFGHPEQDRAISLREAAMLQGFPRSYKFVKSADEVSYAGLGRLIGNAVPPPLAKAVGHALTQHVASTPEGDIKRSS